MRETLKGVALEMCSLSFNCPTRKDLVNSFVSHLTIHVWVFKMLPKTMYL